MLENNIVQTAGSAGESIAFGIGVTMPAILILGFDLELTRVMLVAMLGGLLGILMMIPLRRALIVAQHGFLKYPEGTACAEVLKAGASDESRAAAAVRTRRHAAVVDEATTGGKTILAGFGIGFLYYGIQEIWKTWKEYPDESLWQAVRSAVRSRSKTIRRCSASATSSDRASHRSWRRRRAAYLVLIPAIKFFGSGWSAPLAPETAHLIKDMSVVADSEGIRPVHRRRRSRGRRNHQPVSFAAGDLERSERRPRRSARRQARLRRARRGRTRICR